MKQEKNGSIKTVKDLMNSENRQDTDLKSKLIQQKIHLNIHLHSLLLSYSSIHKYSLRFSNS